MPNGPVINSSILGTEKHDVRSKQRRPETRSRTRATEGQRSSYRSRPTGQTAQDVCPGLRATYEDEIDAILVAYPKTRVWRQKEGLWLLTPSGLLPGLRQNATFLTGVPFIQSIPVRGWGFWPCSVWIGPRHTNFPDGSICAYEPSDGTWSVGGSIVELLDLYSVWALRHLYLKRFGRWPGYQAVIHPFERILELGKDEYCGCENRDSLYGDCCRDRDLARNRAADAVNFMLWTGGGRREPPLAIMRFLLEQKQAPQILDLLRH